MEAEQKAVKVEKLRKMAIQEAVQEMAANQEKVKVQEL